MICEAVVTNPYYMDCDFCLTDSGTKTWLNTNTVKLYEKIFLLITFLCQYEFPFYPSVNLTSDGVFFTLSFYVGGGDSILPFSYENNISKLKKIFYA